jgi:hypothetical protein
MGHPVDLTRAYLTIFDNRLKGLSQLNSLGDPSRSVLSRSRDPAQPGDRR